MSKSVLSCRDCATGTYEPRQYSVQTQINGKAVLIEGLSFYLCESCESELITPEQSRANDKLVCDAKRREMGYLVSQEIIDLRKALGLTQARAAKAFGGGLNAFSKYERGEIIQSEPMDKLMRMVKRKPSRLIELIDESQPKVNKAQINVSFEPEGSVRFGAFQSPVKSASNEDDHVECVAA